MVKIYLQRYEQCSASGDTYPVITDIVVENWELEAALKENHVVSASIMPLTLKVSS